MYLQADVAHVNQDDLAHVHPASPRLQLHHEVDLNLDQLLHVDPCREITITSTASFGVAQ
jgi:hypothetical protein